MQTIPAFKIEFGEKKSFSFDLNPSIILKERNKTMFFSARPLKGANVLIFTC